MKTQKAGLPSLKLDTVMNKLSKSIDDFDQNFKIQKIKENNGKHLKHLSNFNLLKVIGKGTFSKVILVRNRIDGLFYALKVMKKHKIMETDFLENIQREKRILSKLDHPFIIKLYSTFQTKEKIYMITEYTNGGEMFFHLKQKKHFNEETAKFIAAELYLALSYLHSNNILYRDIKPENILFDAEGHIKLIDFGLSNDNISDTNLTDSVCGTNEYLRIF